MKVVIFCGGLGMRLREYSESIPKPMVPVGYRPILWTVDSGDWTTDATPGSRQGDCARTRICSGPSRPATRL